MLDTAFLLKISRKILTLPERRTIPSFSNFCYNGMTTNFVIAKETTATRNTSKFVFSQVP